MEGKEEEKSFTERIYEHVEDYAKTTVELYRLKAIKVFSDVFASVATGFIIWVIISFFLVFLSIGFGFWIGEMLGACARCMVSGFFRCRWNLCADRTYHLRFPSQMSQRANQQLYHQTNI
jgi:hypothetical protein